MSIEASTSTPVLLADLEQVLGPKLRQVKPDAILVMDNLRPHRATEVSELLNQAGIGLVDLPRYSPEFNPIEQAWAKMKERLKAKAVRSLEALEAELKPALETITVKDARGWFRHAGYALHLPQIALLFGQELPGSPPAGRYRCPHHGNCRPKCRATCVGGTPEQTASRFASCITGTVDAVLWLLPGAFGRSNKVSKTATVSEVARASLAFRSGLSGAANRC